MAHFANELASLGLAHLNVRLLSSHNPLPIRDAVSAARLELIASWPLRIFLASQEMQVTQIILTLANGVCFIFCILYFRRLLHRVALERLCVLWQPSSCVSD